MTNLLDAVRITFLSGVMSLFPDFDTWTIQFFSTLPERLLLFVPCLIVLMAVFVAANRFRLRLLRILVPAIAAFVLFLIVYKLFPSDHDTVTALSLGIAAGITQFGQDLRVLRNSTRRAVFICSAILISGLGVAVLNGWSLMELAKKLHADTDVQQFASGDFNGIAVDPDRGVLFASGHDNNHLLVYDLKALDHPPQESTVELGWPQEFDYNPSKQEIYVFNLETHTLLFLNAITLAVTKSVSGLNLSDWDTVIVHDNNTDSIIVAAEDTWPLREPGADDATKSPVAIVDRSTGQMRYQIRWCEGWCNPGMIIMHPNKPIVYLGFTDTNLAYDTEMRKIVARSPGGYRWMSNLAMTPDGAELLVSAPAYSAVLRFDAVSLQYKGRISSVLGVRALGVDSERNLLLAGSLSNNMLDVIDLKTKTRVAQYWVGPWLRKISVDSKRGLAIVSSIQGLFRVDYLTRIAGNGPHRSSRQ